MDMRKLIKTIYSAIKVYPKFMGMAVSQYEHSEPTYSKLLILMNFKRGKGRANERPKGYLWMFHKSRTYYLYDDIHLSFPFSVWMVLFLRYRKHMYMLNLLRNYNLCAICLFKAFINHKGK